MRLIKTDLFNLRKSVRSVKSAFYSINNGTLIRLIRRIKTDLFYLRKSVRSVQSAFYYNWNADQTDFKIHRIIQS